jgi:alkaline phosphatase D
MSTRRQFLARSATATAAVLLPGIATTRATAAPVRGGRFAQGIFSGDPTPSGITLSTVLSEVEGAGTVGVEVARDSSFRNVIARKQLSVREASGFSAKVRISDLEPSERYFYRFETRDRTSQVGRFQTAPAPDSRETVRFAFLSCADYSFGWYNAYERLASEDIDFVVCLGDYIYTESEHSVAEGDAVRDDLTGSPNPGRPDIAREAQTLADYRAKYALYRSDPALRKAHRQFPWICIWDDHEVQNDFAGSLPDGGLPGQNYTVARRDAAFQAFFEAMPFVPSGRSRIYRTLRFGRNVDLVMLDERQYRGDQPCGDKTGPPCPEQPLPRAYLGTRQMAYLKDRLRGSDAAWKIVGNGALIMPIKVSPVAIGGFDSWQGYLAEREDLLAYLATQQIKDVIFATGDAHTFLAGDVRPAQSTDPATTVAIEFQSGSITSPAPGDSVPANPANPATPPIAIDVLRGFNPWLANGDISRHGYGVAQATRRELKVAFRRMRTIKQRSNATEPDLSWTIERGQRGLVGH